MDIKKNFENSEIFITGGTGVVGKALIEKLFRSCNVKKIYMLLRPKKNVEIEERLNEFKQNLIFRELKKIKPYELDEKLVAIPGDAVLPGLGVTHNYIELMQNIQFVFHCAATVSFNEPLKHAIKLNIGGTHEALEFAAGLKKLKMFMHVSTFYSNPHLYYIEAKMYPAPMDWRVCLKLLHNESISEDVLNALTRKLITGFPNTYTFTKNVAESLVNEYRTRLPVAIYRPSIILPSLDEPEPGFPPSLTGATALVAVANAGIAKSLYTRQIFLDVIPQDYSTNFLIYDSVKALKIYSKGIPDEVPVYIFSARNITHITTKYIFNVTYNLGVYKDAPYEKSFLLPYLYCTSSRWLYLIMMFMCHLLPGLVMDTILVMLGRKPVLLSIYRKYYVLVEVLKPFLNNDYPTAGVDKADLEILHKSEFACDSMRNYSEVILFKYLFNMNYKIREILLKEDPKSIPVSRTIYMMKLWLTRLIGIWLLMKLYQWTVKYVTERVLS